MRMLSTENSYSQSSSSSDLKVPIDAWDESECRTELRFGKQDLDLLRRNLQIPDEIVCCQRSVFDGTEAMCLLLKRIDYLCRYTDMVPRFARNPTELCLIFNEVLDFIYTSRRHRLQNWDRNPFLQPDQLHRYADAIHQQGAPLNNCFGFVDGTVRAGIARPKYNQRVMYNGYKRIKYKIPKCGYTKWPYCKSQLSV